MLNESCPMTGVQGDGRSDSRWTADSQEKLSVGLGQDQGWCGFLLQFICFVLYEG